MTEVAQPKLFSICEPDRMNLNPDYITCDALFGSSIDDEQTRIYDKANALGGRREEGGLRRSPDGAGHSGGVANIWEEDERDREEEEGDSGLYEVPADPGYDLDRFVEDEFQFLDSDDDDEGEGRRLARQGPLLGTEMLDQTPSPPSPQPSLTDHLDSVEEALSSDLDEPVVASRSLIPQESLDYVSVPDLGSPSIPAPPPLPPMGALFAMNSKSATEQLDIGDGPQTSHHYEAANIPETIHGAGVVVPLSTRPKDRPKNEPQSPQNEHFLELQGILNRRLRKIDEDIERNREAEGSVVASAAAAVAVVPIRQTQKPLSHQMSSHWKPSEQAAIDTDHHLNSFLPEVPGGSEDSDEVENISSAIPSGTKAAHMEDSPLLTLVGGNTNFLPDPVLMEPSIIENSGRFLPNISDSLATEAKEEFSIRGKDLDYRGMADLPSQALLVPGKAEEQLECRGVNKAQTIQTEVKERLEVPGDETVRTLIPDVDPELEQLRPGVESVALHQVSSSASVPDMITSSNPLSVNVLTDNHFTSSSNALEINPVVKRAEQVARPRPNSGTIAAVHFWDTQSGDEWTPQMDLMDNEFDDDFPTEIISRRHHRQKRQPDKAKRTPSKLYQKKQLGGPHRPAPNPGAFSLARINRAVKKVFGSISSKPSSKQRAPISDSVFLQEDGWEIYPARPYDQSSPGEAVKVVGVEKRPAYAYNAFTRQLVILPDHDRILVTDDGRRIRDQNGKAIRPTSPGGNASASKTGNREKLRLASKSKASSPRPPNLNTKTVKSIQMHGRPESFVEGDSQVDSDDAYWRRNSSPHFVGSAAAPSTNLSKKKTSTLSQILSFRKSSGKSTESGRKGVDERLTASDVELLKKGGQTTRQVAQRPV